MIPFVVVVLGILAVLAKDIDFVTLAIIGIPVGLYLFNRWELGQMTPDERAIAARKAQTRR